MSIHEMYFVDEFFKSEVDAFVVKHQTTHAGAFKCIEIKEAYERRLGSYYHADKRRLRQ